MTFASNLLRYTLQIVISSSAFIASVKNFRMDCDPSRLQNPQKSVQLNLPYYISHISHVCALRQFTVTDIRRSGDVPGFEKKAPGLESLARRFLEPIENRRNLRSMPKISYAASPCLSQLISAQFALEMCIAARNRQKIHKTHILSFKVI